MENKSNFSIATWNVCLGIANKKDSVTETLNHEGISVCCIQETDQGFPIGVLNCNNYILELEMNDYKMRTGIYLNKNVNYKRRRDLERKNVHIVIIDIIGHKNCRIISVYRSFRPTDMSPKELFDLQLEILANSVCNNCYILGDFNLDASI